MIEFECIFESEILYKFKNIIKIMLTNFYTILKNLYAIQY